MGDLIAKTYWGPIAVEIWFFYVCVPAEYLVQEIINFIYWFFIFGRGGPQLLVEGSLDPLSPYFFLLINFLAKA